MAKETPHATTDATSKFDAAEFEIIKTRADTMVGALEERDTNFDKYERAYRIDPQLNSATSSASSGLSSITQNEGNTTAPRAHKLFDPHGHNTVNIVVRMYATNEPSINIPTPTIDPTTDPAGAASAQQNKRKIDKVEAFLKALLYQSDMVSERSFVSDLLAAAAIFGEVPAIIDNAMGGEIEVDSDLVPAPFLFEVPHPRNSYPQYSRRHGLYRHVFQVEQSLGALREDFGDAAKFIEGKDDEGVTLRDYMDKTQHWVWSQQHTTQPLLFAQMNEKLGVIPRVSRIVSSPGFFEAEKDRRMPLLYAYIKSGLWGARNVMFTIMQTNIVDYLNPKMLKKMQPGREHEGDNPDWTKRGDVLEGYQIGESIEPLARQLVPPELWQFQQLVTFLTEESTISRISSGVTPGGVFAASGLNLMASLSRMATFPIARTVETALAQVLSRTLRWIKVGGYRPTVWGLNGPVTISADDIGDNYRVVVKLNPDQTSERQMIVALATQMFRGLGLGYSDVLRVLEQGGLIDSPTSAMDGVIERAMMEAELPNIAKQSAETARALMGITQAIPEMPQASPPNVGGLQPGGLPPQPDLSASPSIQPPQAPAEMAQ